AQHIASRHRQALEAPRGLVPNVTHRAAREPRQVTRAVAPVAPELLAEKVERIRVVDGASAAILDDRRGAVAEDERRSREDANEGVTAHALAALDALEQEGSAERAQFRERGDRRLEIR